jgi:hypothetical protein
MQGSLSFRIFSRKVGCMVSGLGTAGTLVCHGGPTGRIFGISCGVGSRWFFTKSTASTMGFLSG